MKTLKRILTGLLIFVVVILIGAFVAYRVVTHRALPDYNKDIAMKGLQSEVTIMRDQYAVPHIYAENEHDLYMAVGYAMAQERLWQMDFLRRVTQGRLSEIFGNSFVDTDYLLRLLRYQAKSEKILKEVILKLLLRCRHFPMVSISILKTKPKSFPSSSPCWDINQSHGLLCIPLT